MQYRYLFFASLICSFLFSNQILGQKSPFGAGIVAGINASQINGDKAAGFNKVGLKAGLQGVIHLQERWNVVIELLYSQRGSVDKADFLGDDNIFTRFHLDYFEVPILIEFLDWKVDDYYKMHFSAGLSGGYLREAKIEGNSIGTELLNDRDLSILTGIDFYANKHLGAGMRFTYSLNRLYTGVDRVDDLRGYFLSFHAIYRI